MGCRSPFSAHTEHYVYSTGRRDYSYSWAATAYGSFPKCRYTLPTTASHMSPYP